jgi:hypothetical protein
MNAKLLGVVALLGIALWVLVSGWRRQAPGHYLAGHQWPVHCIECGADTSLTTEEMDRMIKRGEALAPEYEPRRFKCPECGEIALTIPPVSPGQ